MAYALSLVYLLFELSFSARLLDIVGSPGRVSQDDIDGIEAWGRCLSGVALALVIWSLVILPRVARWGYLKSALALVASAGLSVFASWQIQEHIVRALVDHSTARGRQAAVWMTQISAELLNGCVALEGASDQARLFATPEGKTLLAFLPIAANGLDSLGKSAEPVIRAMVRYRVQDRTGRPDEAWVTKWQLSRNVVSGWWTEYEKAHEPLDAALRDIARLRADAVTRYEQQLRQKGLRLGSIRPDYFRQIRQAVAAELRITVPESWNPNDRDELGRMVERHARAQADAAWKAELSKRRLTGLPPRLEVIPFFLHPEIQREWRNLLQLTSTPVLDPNYTFEPWRQRIWDVEIKSLVDRDMAVYTASLREYEDGGQHEEAGRTAFKAAVVPPLALFFSLIGAIAHIAKLAASTIGFFWRGPAALVAAGMVYVVAATALWVFPSSHQNDATRSGLFGRMVTGSQDTWGATATGIMYRLVQAEPFFYGVGDWLRRHVLDGFHYGVSDLAMTSAHPPSWCQGTRVAAPVDGRSVPAAAGPRRSSQPAVPADLPWLRGPAQCGGVAILAHRGARPAIENTIDAVQAAPAAGYQGAEIDIQRTRDGHWVLHHDMATGRVVVPPRNPVLVSQLTMSDWRSAALMSPSGEVDKGRRPSDLAAVVAAARAGGVNLEIEIKADVSCAEVREAMRLAAPLGATIRWTTAYRGVATCLAEAIGGREAGIGAGYVGLIVGPPEGSRSADADYQRMLFEWLHKRGDIPKQDWNMIANREFASADGVRRAATLLDKATRRGLHLPGIDLERQPALPQAVMAARMRYSLYDDRGDEHLARVVRTIAPDDLKGLDALVIDGPVEPFCRAAFPGR